MDFESAPTENLFVSDDEDDEDTRLNNQYEEGIASKKARLGKINRHANEAEEGLLDEHKMEDQEMFVSGSSEFVKIIDKSRRAFSFSLDSTRAF